MQPIAFIETEFNDKFGIPRQSGLVEELRGHIVFEPAYRDLEAVRGLEDFSHIWILWEFSKAKRDGWSPTVRPPRLGGNKRMGVFATRSPFRPNPIGLSVVRLVAIRQANRPELIVAGADLMNGTPIYDIKPYLPYADCIPTATGGFADAAAWHPLTVVAPPQILAIMPEELRPALVKVLAQDPRPAYADDPTRIYGMYFAGFNVQFTVANQTLTVQTVTKID